MKILQRNRIRRPSLAEFIRRGPFGYISYVYTNEQGNKVTARHRLKPSDMDVSVTSGEAGPALRFHYSGLAL